MPTYIHEQEGWPRFHWSSEGLAEQLGDAQQLALQLCAIKLWAAKEMTVRPDSIIVGRRLRHLGATNDRPSGLPNRFWSR